MKRIDLWRGPFEEAVDAMKAEPFSWGNNDCATGLVSRLTLALTGVDFGKEHRGMYHDSKSALKYLKSLKYNDLADVVKEVLPEIPVSQATIGDIVAIPVNTPFKHALGVVNGDRVFVMTEEGHGTVDLLTATRAFRIGSL